MMRITTTILVGLGLSWTLFLPQAQGTLSVECVPLSGNIVTGAQMMDVECFVTSNVNQAVAVFNLDFACLLTAGFGSAGSITVIALTPDPDGDFACGPSSGGVPFLLAISAFCAANFELCHVFASNLGPGDPPPSFLPAGASRYLGTLTLSVSDCASGDFNLILEDFHNPPQDGDHTLFLDGNQNLIPLTYDPLVLTVLTGTCCEGSSCVDDNVNEFCCSQEHPGAEFRADRACADLDACGCANDQDCSDGQFCNGQETCDALTERCMPGTPPSCDDGFSCTSDTCNMTTNGCTHVPNNALCDDGLFCTGAETCDGAAGCVAGAAPCAPDLLCDEATQQCTVPPIPTVSQWGLVILALLLVTGAKVMKA